MRATAIFNAIFFGTILSLAVEVGPSLAKTSEAPKAVDETASPPCHAYEQNPDGSWKQIPCLEEGHNPSSGSRISNRDAGKTAR